MILHFVFGRKNIQDAPDVMSFSIAWRTPSPLMLLSCTEFSFPWSKKKNKKLSLTDQAKHCTWYSINEAPPYRLKKVNSISTQDLSNKSNMRLCFTTFSTPRKLKIQYAVEHFWWASRCWKCGYYTYCLECLICCNQNVKLTWKVRRYWNNITISFVQT